MELLTNTVAFISCRCLHSSLLFTIFYHFTFPGFLFILVTHCDTWGASSIAPDARHCYSLIGTAVGDNHCACTLLWTWFPTTQNRGVLLSSYWSLWFWKWGSVLKTKQKIPFLTLTWFQNYNTNLYWLLFVMATILDFTRFFLLLSS